MSILNRLRLNSHLDDAALAAIWTDRALNVAGAHPHLQNCAACRSRFDDFSAWLDELRLEAGAEADDAFPHERLAAQQAQIFRRLEAAERPARVIAFPKFAQPLSGRPSHASRWIAAAAAAGLIVGVGVGQLMDLRHPVLRQAAPMTQAHRVEPSRSPVQPVATTLGDEAFLSEVDATLARQSVPELHALDAFTPRAGEVRR